jgi:hypothetical protein
MLGIKKLVLSVALVGSMLCLNSQVWAQDIPKPETGRPQAKVSDSELTAFAKTYVEYQRIRQQYEPSIRNSQGAQKKKIEDEANAKVKELLAKQRLTVESYNRLFKLVNSDEQLRKKALKLVEEERRRS